MYGLFYNFAKAPYDVGTHASSPPCVSEVKTRSCMPILAYLSQVHPGRLGLTL